MSAAKLSVGTVNVATATVGTISFLNCHPIRWGLARQSPAFRLVSGPPGYLASELLSGRLDVGPVSLLDYLEHADALALLPGPAICSDGPVLSCVLASRVPLARLDGRPVRLSAASRTTVLLARIYLEDVLGVRPYFVTAGPGWPGPGQPGPGQTGPHLTGPHPTGLEPVDSEADAFVEIGDEALRLAASPPPGVTVYDLGTLWRSWTGLPMVFAVWVARRDFAADCPAALRSIQNSLARALIDALDQLPAVAADAVPLSGGLDERVLLSYFRTLDYSFGERQQAGLRAFAALAASRGIPEGRPPGQTQRALTSAGAMP
jgi:chorismate dehydratase